MESEDLPGSTWIDLDLPGQFSVVSDGRAKTQFRGWPEISMGLVPGN